MIGVIFAIVISPIIAGLVILTGKTVEYFLHEYSL